MCRHPSLRPKSMAAELEHHPLSPEEMIGHLVSRLRYVKSDFSFVGETEQQVAKQLSELDRCELRRLRCRLVKRVGPEKEFYLYWTSGSGHVWEKRTGRPYVNVNLAAKCVIDAIELPKTYSGLYDDGWREYEWQTVVPDWAVDVLNQATGLTNITGAAYLCRLADITFRECARRGMS